MAKRERKRLTQRQVQTISKEGRHADGGGLYLVVDASSARRWVFLYRFNGKRHEMGLGPYPVLSLAEAREKAAEAERQVRLSGINPLEVKRSQASRLALEKTLGEIVDEALPILTQGFRNPVHRQQYYSTLSATYIPHLRSKKISQIEPADVAKDLAPLWKSRGETARRLRGRLEKVFDYAEGKGLISGNNPARLSPALKALLGGEAKKLGGHHSAMPYANVPGFMSRLKERKGTAAEAYRFLILTAARVNEIIGATWDEINWTNETWTVVAERYKTNKAHTVPLSPQALDLLKSIKKEQEQLGLITDYIFTNDKGQNLSNGAFAALQKRMKETDFTTHGFRSSFRDWAGNTTDYPRELLEEALGHEIGNIVERAYRREKAVNKRRTLMVEWADYCHSQ